MYMGVAHINLQRAIDNPFLKLGVAAALVDAQFGRAMAAIFQKEVLYLNEQSETGEG